MRIPVPFKTHRGSPTAALALLAMLCYLGTPAHGAPPPRAADQHALRASGDSPHGPFGGFGIADADSFIEATMAGGHVAGLGACVVRTDGFFWTKGYGFADLAEGIPVEAGTLFMLASISKVATATAAMQLWEENLFSLDDDINAYLPFDVTNPSHPGSPITFRMLMTHTSGIRDNWDIMPYWPGDSPIPLGVYLEDYLDPGGELYDPDFNYYTWEPGTQYRYCNIAIALLGFLVEFIGGSPFDDYCEQEIFTPLWMTETAWHFADLNPDHIAVPYRYSGGNYIPYEHYGYSDYPSGQLRTSANQLGYLLAAYMNGGVYNGARILESATVDSMLTPQIPDILGDQGLVWYGGSTWGHSGGDLGVSTTMFFHPREGVGVVVLTNGENDGVTTQIADWLYDNATKISAGLPPAVEETPGVALVVHPNPFRAGTRLVYQAPSSGQVQISIHDASGRLVRTLVSKTVAPGRHTVVWDGTDARGHSLAGGTYWSRIRSGPDHAATRIVLLR